jgi:hypothetical protein
VAGEEEVEEWETSHIMIKVWVGLQRM